MYLDADIAFMLCSLLHDWVNQEYMQSLGMFIYYDYCLGLMGKLLDTGLLLKFIDWKGVGYKERFYRTHLMSWLYLSKKWGVTERNPQFSLSAFIVKTLFKGFINHWTRFHLFSSIACVHNWIQRRMNSKKTRKKLHHKNSKWITKYNSFFLW